MTQYWHEIFPYDVLIKITTYLFNTDYQIIRDYKKYVMGLYIKPLDFKIDKVIFRNIRYLRFKLMNQTELRQISRLEIREERAHFMSNLHVYFRRLRFIDYANDINGYNKCTVARAVCGSKPNNWIHLL